MCFYNISQALCEMHPCPNQLRAGGITIRGSDIKRAKATNTTCHLETLLYTPAASVSLSVVLRMSASSQFIFPTAWPQQLPGLIAKGSRFAIPGFVDSVICRTLSRMSSRVAMTNVPLP